MKRTARVYEGERTSHLEKDVANFMAGELGQERGPPRVLLLVGGDAASLGEVIAFNASGGFIVVAQDTGKGLAGGDLVAAMVQGTSCLWSGVRMRRPSARSARQRPAAGSRRLGSRPSRVAASSAQTLRRRTRSSTRSRRR